MECARFQSQLRSDGGRRGYADGIPGGENGLDFAHKISMGLPLVDMTGNVAWWIDIVAVEPTALKLHSSHVRIKSYRGLQQCRMARRIGWMMRETKP
jgi:hypothetical protein